MRMVLTGIVFIAIFFIGLVYGINYDQSSSEDVAHVVEEVSVEEVVVVEESMQSSHLGQENPTEKNTSYSVASALEGLFTILAETFIQILYQFSKLFI